MMTTIPNAIWDESQVNEVLTDLAVASADLEFHTIGVGVLTALHGVKPFFFTKNTMGDAVAAPAGPGSLVGRHFGFLSWTFEPLFWSDLVLNPDLWSLNEDDVRSLGGWLSDMQLKRGARPEGIVIPMHGPAAHCGVVTMWGGQDTADCGKHLKLQALGGRAHWRIFDLMRGPETRKTSRVERFGLTSRELEVLKCLSQGDTNVQAAESLGIKERTVLHHVAQARQKLDCNTRVETVSRAIRVGLI